MSYARVLIISVFVFKLSVTILVVIAKMTIFEIPTHERVSLGVDLEILQGGDPLVIHPISGSPLA